MGPLNVLEPEEAVSALHHFMRVTYEGQVGLSILEAGCGRNGDLGLETGLHHLVGIDLDEDALQFRRDKWGDLDEEIVADLRKVELESESFDIIFSAWVLEHISGAEEVLNRFVSWLRPGGIMIIRVPDGNSVFGWVTRNTPHRVHVLYKRWIQRRPNAGRPGYGPYPTVYDTVISRDELVRYCRERDLEILREDGMAIQGEKLGRFASPIRLFMRVLSRLSGGRLAGDHVNLQYVIRKPI